MYKEKLRERDRRKTVVKELGLIEAFFKVGACLVMVVISLLMPFHHQENSLNSATGKLSAPKLKKRDPRTEVFDRLKVFNGVQVMNRNYFRLHDNLKTQGIEEHKKLIASVTKEKELKTRIKELIR